MAGRVDSCLLCPAENRCHTDPTTEEAKGCRKVEVQLQRVREPACTYVSVSHLKLSTIWALVVLHSWTKRDFASFEQEMMQ